MSIPARRGSVKGRVTFADGGVGGSSSIGRRGSPGGSGSGQLPVHQLERLRQAFLRFDTDHSGKIDLAEFQYAVRKLKANLSETECAQLFQEHDRNGDGEIDFEEYMELMQAQMKESNKEDEMDALYKTFCDKRTGRASSRTLRRAVRELGVDITDEEIDHMFVSGDFNKDGYIDREDFNQILNTVGFH